MNACSFMILAQIHRFDGLRNRFSSSRSHFGMDDAITGIIAILAIAILLYLVNRWHNRHSTRQSYNSSSAMFRELCKAHDLDRKTRQLLKRVARWQGLAQPARMFLEPERFEPINLSPELERYSAELFELRSKLFTFEVQQESHDSLPDLAEVTTKANSLNPAERVPENSPLAKFITPPPDAPTEAIGAAAFASTTLESTVHTSELDS